MSVAAIGNIPTSRLQTGSLTQNQDFDEDFEEKDLAEDNDDVRIRTMWRVGMILRRRMIYAEDFEEEYLVEILMIFIGWRTTRIMGRTIGWKSCSFYKIKGVFVLTFSDEDLILRCSIW